jgi:hypothetical protein
MRSESGDVEFFSFFLLEMKGFLFLSLYRASRLLEAEAVCVRTVEQLDCEQAWRSNKDQAIF